MYTTPKTLVLSEGEYQISMVERVIKKKWKLPFVYVFAKWSDGCSTPSRRVFLDRELKLCAQFKIALKASLKLWGENAWGVMTSALNRFNKFHRKYPALFWLIEILLSSLLFALSEFLKLFKTEEHS